VELGDLPLFADVSSAELDAIEHALTPTVVHAGDFLMRQDEESTFFALVTGGTAEVVRNTAHGERQLAIVGRGDIVGELGLLLRRERVGSVRALTDLSALVGDLVSFDRMLSAPGVHDHVEAIVSARLAERVTPVPIHVRDGRRVFLRPILPTDRDALYAAMRDASAETLRLRFFQAFKPNSRIISYLVDIYYIHHFAWVAVTEAGDGVGIGRYIRHAARPNAAEFAFSVHDSWHGLGLGTTLLGGCGVAAVAAGVTTMTASFLSENHPVRAVLSKVRATISRGEPGVLEAVFDASIAADLLPEADADALRAAVVNVVLAAGLVLADS
jgi:protein lysine acetyltransferase